MDIVKESVIKNSTSCNFCQKGELNKHKRGLIYPYENVVTFKRDNGNGLCASICEDCLDELYNEGKMKFNS